MGRIRSIELRRLRQPLIRPYRLSYRTFEEFEPYLVRVEDDAGRRGFADGHISPGSSSETRDGGWAFLTYYAQRCIGLESGEAAGSVLQHFEESKVAATALVTALEVMDSHPALDIPEPTRLPLLTPVNAMEPAAIEREIAEWLAQGFRTFKVKVGKDVAADLARVAAIQRSVAGRATLRLDANRAFSREDGVRFASALDPAGIELFEQPCDSDDWDANAAVAAASPVPLMLDEPICTLDDIDRAATIPGVGYCKLKLKRFGSISRLIEGLDRLKSNDLGAVLGDGLGSEAHNWLEACAARGRIANAGEFNGFLKPRERLLAEPMPFVDGAIALPAGYHAKLDDAAVTRFTVETATFR